MDTKSKAQELFENLTCKVSESGPFGVISCKISRDDFDAIVAILEAYLDQCQEVEKAYFRGLRDAKVMVFRYGCEIGDSEEHISAMIDAQNLISCLIDKETMDEARKLVRTWPGYKDKQ